jgi:O-antigen biosynthesis protein
LRQNLINVARLVYSHLPLSSSAKARLRLIAKTRFGVLFGRARSWTYARWVRTFDSTAAADRQAIATYFTSVLPQVHFTVIVPVPAGDNSLHMANACVESVRNQFFPAETVLLCGPRLDGPTLASSFRASTAGKLQCLAVESTEPAAWLNAAVAAVQHPWVLVLRHDVVLSEDALALVASAIHQHPQAVLLYGDEDRLTLDGGRTDPNFKPEFDPDLLLAQDYFGPAVIIHRKVIERAGGFDDGFDDAALFDFCVRAASSLTPAEIARVPFVLTHLQPGGVGRAHPDHRLKAVQHNLDGGNLRASVRIEHGNALRVQYPVPVPAPLVTLIVPTRDRVDLLAPCIHGLLHETDYPAAEVIIVDNQSRDPATLAYLREAQGDPRVHVLHFDAPFNFARMNNLAAQQARGSLLGMINNDIQVIRPDWLAEMVGHALRSGVGPVGAKLLYGDDSIQHAGVTLGLNGVSGHVYRHFPENFAGNGARLRSVHTMSAVAAACLIVRRDLFESVSGLDESLPIFHQDIDFCLKLGAAGHRTVWTPHAVLHHLEGVSLTSTWSPERRQEQLRSDRVLWERWRPLLENDPYYSPNLTLNQAEASLAIPPRVSRPWRKA